MVPIFAVIIVIVVFIFFQERINKRQTKRFEKKTRGRYEKVIDKLRKAEEDEQKKQDDNS